MTRLAPLPPDPPPETVETLFAELLALVAETVLDIEVADKRAMAREAAAERARQERLAAYRDAIARQPMRPVAAALARAAANRDRAGVDALLSRPRTQQEWRQIALILATAADPERIAVAAPPGNTAPAGRQELRRAS